ncbi:MAG: tetratricopeptide repeat protein [Timaviella obliquedivisa GSE-PSE-MK23-08B]|jgi:serine/threonine protein kinase|nr:tetratricopeptide repeat protein [Timaviella obliquedivisa GSE-PSE-MK23-08B]
MSLSLPQSSSEIPLGGRYKIISHLGAGGFGQTFLAEDLHLPGHPVCVLKQLKPEISNDNTLQMARRCFNTEAKVLYQLGIHEQIPRLLAHFEQDKEFYLAQEFIEGNSLTEELTEGKVWSEDYVINLLKEILHILSFVHQQQVIHRDIKPSNLIRRKKDDRIELIDFGAVKQVGTLEAIDAESGLTNVTISIGTKGYMPSEQLAGKPRFSSDIYAVGILGIQALTGVHPRHFEEDTQGEIAWHHRVAQVSPALRAVLDRMVNYDFRSRYLDALEALEALEVLETLETLPLPASAVPKTAGRLNSATVLQNLTQFQSKNGSTGRASRGKSVEPQGQDDESPATAIWLTASSESGVMERSDLTHLTTHAIGRSRPSTVSTRVARAMGASAGSDATSMMAEDNDHRRQQAWIGLGAIALLGLAYTLAQLFVPNWSEQFLNPAQTPDALAQTDKDALTPEEQAIEFLKQANLKMQAGESAASLKLYDKSLALKADSPEANAGRCEALNHLNRPDEAIVFCNDALAYKPNYSQALWSKGNALFLQKRQFEALKLYEEVTERKPEFAPGWVRLGMTLQALGRSAEALNALDKGIALYRNSAEAWGAKGKALLNLQRYEQAVIAFNKALQIQPDDLQWLKLKEQARSRQR